MPLRHERNIQIGSSLNFSNFPIVKYFAYAFANLSKNVKDGIELCSSFFSFRSRSSDMTPPPEVQRIPTITFSPHRISVSSPGILMISIYSKFDINRRSSGWTPASTIQDKAKR